MNKSVLIVEDNQDMRHGLETFLRVRGLQVYGVASCEDGIDEIDENTYDAAIVDINLPGKSGFEMIEYIRSSGSKMPVIAMTARDGIEDKLRGFDLGLTDYIVKPFDLSEMYARLQAHMKSSPKDGVYEIGDFYLDTHAYMFKKAGKRVALTQTEFRIVQILIKNTGTLVTSEELISHVWGEDPDMINPPTRIHIANVRKKINDTDYSIIRTIPGTGYIFNIEDRQQ